MHCSIAHSACLVCPLQVSEKRGGASRPQVKVFGTWFDLNDTAKIQPIQQVEEEEDEEEGAMGAAGGGEGGDCVLAASWLTDAVVWGRQWEWWANEIGAF